jgi:hypothetical protein
VNRRERITKELVVEPGTDANIAGRDPAWTGGPDVEDLSEKKLSRTAKGLLAEGVKELSKAQELLWASEDVPWWSCGASPTLSATGRAGSPSRPSGPASVPWRCSGQRPEHRGGWRRHSGNVPTQRRHAWIVIRRLPSMG